MSLGISPIVVKTLKGGGVGILPTDTIYGVVGSALKRKTVERIYSLRKRSPKKPMIILIGSVAQLKVFGIKIDRNTRAILRKLWPGKMSVILRVKSREARVKFKYLHREMGTLAFRLPKPLWLRRLLKKTGPLVAPSANLKGKPPAETIKEAKKYLGDKVDFYVDAGPLRSRPSTLVKIVKGKVFVLRAGADSISKIPPLAI